MKLNSVCCKPVIVQIEQQLSVIFDSQCVLIVVMFGLAALVYFTGLLVLVLL